MPQTIVRFYADVRAGCPLIDWLDAIPAKARDKCVVRLERLAELGHELRRPEADLLRDGIYELRVGLHGVNYRMLYFFHGRGIAVVAHAITKERQVPPQEIETALVRRANFIRNPEAHTYRERT
ncbi:MAG TPA: type II toxin-antitoxin system RelE/ParE family toxin [Phycisphaerae bacterium]|nr:type II toxin-antitoxin system RelE/ParE family toxin [Phycisphaerae bacterium]